MSRPGEDRELARAIDQLDSTSLRWAIDAVRFVRNPVFSGALFASLLVVLGVGVLAYSYVAMSDQYYVALQVPYVVSGGFAALGLIITGAILCSVLGSRRDNALADDEMSALLVDLTDVVRTVARTRSASELP